MVLGILSLLSACYMVGIVLGIVALALSSKGRQLYKENPNGYNGYGMLNAGFVCAILGIVLGGLFLLGFLVSGVGILGSGIWALL